MTIHILSDRRLPISNSPVAAVPLLPRSGFVQCPDSSAAQGNLDEGDAISEKDGYPVTAGDTQAGKIACDPIDGCR